MIHTLLFIFSLYKTSKYSSIPGKAVRSNRFLAFGAVLLFCWSGMILTPAPVSALTNYTDPSGYPTSWPSTWNAYTRLGTAQSDSSSGGDDNSDGGTNPTKSADFSNGPGEDQPSFYYNVDTVNDILFFRLRIDGPPNGGGISEPFSSESWTILFDTDGDGFKEWVVMLDGSDGDSTEPDDIVVAYNNDNQHSWSASDEAWRQDSADTTQADGPAVSGGVDAWDTDPNTFIWDWGRTRVVQIDTTKAAWDNNVEYFIDIQVPLSAFSKGVETLGATDPFLLAASTGNSNTDPTQKDLLFAGDITAADNAAIPGGDITDSEGNTSQDPVITSITNALSCPEDTLEVQVLDVMDVVGGQTVDTIDTVYFEYFISLDGDDLDDDAGVDWEFAGGAPAVSGSVGLFRLVWDVSEIPNKKILVRAVVEDDQGNITVSTDQSANQQTTFTNTCATGVNLLASTKTKLDTQIKKPGDTVIYEIFVRNEGSATAHNLVVKDTLSSRVEFNIFILGGSSGSVDSTTLSDRDIVTLTKDSLTVGNLTARWRFRAWIKDYPLPIPDSTAVNNKAYIRTDEDSVTVEENFQLESLPDITLLKAVDKTNALPGDTLLYTIDYENVGTDNATSLLVIDGSPDNTTYVSGSVTVDDVAQTDADGDDMTEVTFNGMGHDITVNIGTVAPEATGTIKFKTIVD